MYTVPPSVPLSCELVGRELKALDEQAKVESFQGPCTHRLAWQGHKLSFLAVSQSHLVSD